MEKMRRFVRPILSSGERECFKKRVYKTMIWDGGAQR